MISMVAAMAKNRAIGAQNTLPWHLPGDMQHFRDVTKGHTVVMGRKTFESIIAHSGKPLPGRRNIVLTRSKEFSYPGVEVMRNMEEVTRLTGDIDIIGGAQIYELFLTVADRLNLTEIDIAVKGDAFFPVFDRDVWHEVSRENHSANSQNQYDYSFVVYERITS